MQKYKKTIYFQKIPIPPEYGQSIKNIYFVIENNRSIVFEALKSLDQKTQDQVIELIRKMATVPNFRSPKIKYNLKKYNYGEIRPMPHRFFFFQKCGNNIIFFDYKLKKSDSLGDKTYKNIESKKIRYEQGFKNFKQRD